MQTELFPNCLVDAVFCGIHCPPGLTVCTKVETLMGPGMGPAVYDIQLLSLSTLIRLYSIVSHREL